MIFHSFQVLSNLDSRVDAADQRMTNDVPCRYAGDFMGLMMCLALGPSRKSKRFGRCDPRSGGLSAKFFVLTSES